MSQNQTVKTIAEADLLRANVYRLLARALSAPADEQFLGVLRGMSGDGTDLGTAFDALRGAASAATVADAQDEYQDLFIGIGRGELVPYGSYYLTGFLNEKPLARLRNDMAPLGIARAEDRKEPEDHAGALCEMMAGLIDGSFAGPASLATQKDFFTKHLGSWMPHFFRDLEKAKNAKLLKPIGSIGRIFMEIEDAAFEM
ncbi:TorD/DmsD family molecular chaperone [Oricola cellulosilytica]|uniref:Molecular chaperone TorD n=1 Tax=Oricola cellulosilytica TaxID=1429082 RepID=A0A4R0P8I7_9HYPH|nr:molecular chaperone TorD family protein [Oricola cellulosilytica]TCD11920.1 molecular chaperone TorD [Oricola cellulosilytica]